MADHRLQRLAADATARGWAIAWQDDPHGTTLRVQPAISNPEHQDLLGFAVAVRLGGAALICWAWESLSGTSIEPWEDDRCEHPSASGDDLYPVVETLDDCCQVFDRGVQRYLAHMRRLGLEGYLGDDDHMSTWADIELLGGRR